MHNRDLTVVRIPLRSAKHHFGAYNLRGQRPYNEDTDQAGTIALPAFAKRAPISLVRNPNSKTDGEGTSADSAYGDPQIFYFGVFDGHGGKECSEFLRDELHGYIEEAAVEFRLGSSLKREDSSPNRTTRSRAGRQSTDQSQEMSDEEIRQEMVIPGIRQGGVVEEPPHPDPLESEPPVLVQGDASRAIDLETELVNEYKSTVGGYFRRFKPAHFDIPDSRSTSDPGVSTSESRSKDGSERSAVSLETVLTYAFLRADLDFITAQARKPDGDDPAVSDQPLNRDEVLGQPSHHPPSGHGIGGPTRFKGGSTASVALISTPTAAPFWHPAAQSTLVVAHVGDTRVMLCETATGLARPLTSDHHPSLPTETRRLQRYAGSMITDSFGEERILGLANSRAFGDMQSKRVGVSAEPEISRVELGPAEYSFLVLVSDGVSGTLSDQEIVDIVKEARTPEEGARKVVEYATEVSKDGDNATCLCVRLGGWERRSEGGVGSLGTKEIRDIRRAEANDPRRGRR
jgi:protein phosphatase PTC6